ncbi:MAG: hypothetical protein JSS83_04075 [Cyanobacteria bacterium SZAS LIN-3]|nr:hypothetical protein [Cyanobacteria bacterium SZAS LIN-3]
MRSCCLAIAMLLFTIAGTAGCSSAPKPELHTIKVDLTLRVKDPIIKQLTVATDKVDIVASGEFAPGTYTLSNNPVTVLPGTKFQFSLQLPIKNPDEISTAEASGRLDTTVPLQLGKVSLPKTILLDHGKISGEVDLVGLMGSFLFNMLQFQMLNQSEGGDVQKMISTMHIESANLTLRPDAMMQMGKNKLHVVGDSSVKMLNLTVDKNLDYRGTCQFKLNFAPGSAYITDKVDTVFNGGILDDTVAVERKNRVLTLSPLPMRPAPHITLKDCTYKFGRDKTSQSHSDTSLIRINKFDWANYEAENVPSSYHFDALMALTNTHLMLNFPTYSVDAVFPAAENTRLSLFNDTTGHGISFTTPAPVAEIADIDIKRPRTSIKLALSDAKLGSIDFTKSGELNFNLAEGTSGLRSFEWSNGKRLFKLLAEGASTISITKGMSLALSKERPGAKMHGTIPLSVKLGNAKLSNSQGPVLDFSRLDGQVIVDMAEEVKLSGNANFAIAQCQLLGDTPADVKVQAFRILPGDNAVMTLDGCSIVLPKGTIASMIKKQLPEEKSIDFNKEIFEEKKWRYKDAKVTKLIVRKPLMQNLNLTSPDKADFKVSADVEVNGTIKKAGLLAAFKKDAKKWDTKPWRATAPCTGSGSIKFSFLPNKTLADSDVAYDLVLKMPLPKDIDIDWSEVSGGIIRKAETSVISDYLNKCSPFNGTRIMPLDHKGTLKVFSHSEGGKLQAVKISKFLLKPVSTGTEIDFVGETTL